jgi:adenine-specific DNA-methyltransferase
MKFQKEFEKFQSLLKELFQFEASDLDFGIYRILNYKREQIKDFIENRLPEIVESAFEKHKQALSKNIEEEFNKVKEEIKKNLGAEAISPTGELNEIFKNTPLGKRYLDIKEQKELLEKIEEIKGQVYNDLYNFFSRFYEDGDFIPQYRYSIKGYKYTIPYNGEEVKLYWATADQYYIKTGLLFRDYTFKTGGIKVVFRVVEAKEELGSNKATKERFFVLDDENPIEINENELVIRFQYRELIDDEVRKYEFGERESSSSKQEKINSKIFATIEKFLKNNKQLEFIKYLIDETKNEKPLLLYHINRFTAKNTRDYFIHKNLKKFLSEQLDYFIKSEVLNYETLSEEKYLDKHITRAKNVKEIGEKIIDFLAQIEDFQKRLWEKKKFVIKTEYVITLDRIKSWTNEEFYKKVIKKVLNNPHQLKEWEALGFGKIETAEDLEDKKLPIDTRYFDEDFKFELLEKISENVDIDDALDGLLIKSENWQALDTILTKYKGTIKTIYIDPPYNTGNDGFLYRDRYQHSSWLSMMENRLSLARELMGDDGVIFVSIDDNEVYNLQKILDIVFGEANYITNFCWEKTQHFGRQKVNYYVNRDFILTYAKELKTQNNQLKELLIEKIKTELEDAPLYNASNPEKELVFPKESVVFKIPDGTYEKSEDEKFKLLEPVTVVNHRNINDLKLKFRSRWSQKKIYEEIEKGSKFLIKSKNFAIRVIYGGSITSIEAPRQIIFTNENNPLCTKDRWGSKVGTNEEGSKEVKNLFNKEMYSYPKSSSLIKYLISLTGFTINEFTILDFFAGSGTTAHAVMKLNKEDGGKRKFILVEMADYFDTIIIPRIKKVAYSFNWEDGKPQDEDGIGVFFKYQILEQYEDTLNNIELKENKLAQNLFKDEYLIKYFLEFETRDSPYLLNIEKLKNPFAYKLKVNFSEVGEPKEMIVDIPETFNYLLGLKVKKIKRRRDNGKTYLFVLGEKEGRDYAIVWREYSDQWKEEDFKKDKEFIKQELKEWKPQVVYVNGQSILTPNFGDFQVELNYIEPKFKRLMEG